MEMDLQQLSTDIEGLVRRIEAIPDPVIREDVLTLVRSVMDLHGAGLKRMLDVLCSSGEPGRKILAAIGADDLAGSLLLLHGLHPADTQERIAKALEKTASDLRRHGASAELLGIDNGIVRIRLGGAAHGSGCGSSPNALKAAIEECIYSAAPEIASIEFQGPVDVAALVQLDV